MDPITTAIVAAVSAGAAAGTTEVGKKGPTSSSLYLYVSLFHK